jgi:predicted RNA binding protein with dsRBD fold (UPF0201 family)
MGKKHKETAQSSKHKQTKSVSLDEVEVKITEVADDVSDALSDLSEELENVTTIATLVGADDLVEKLEKLEEFVDDAQEVVDAVQIVSGIPGELADEFKYILDKLHAQVAGAKYNTTSEWVILLSSAVEYVEQIEGLRGSQKDMLVQKALKYLLDEMDLTSEEKAAIEVLLSAGSSLATLLVEASKGHLNINKVEKVVKSWWRKLTPCL